jgi:hypothetical protein
MGMNEQEQDKIETDVIAEIRAETELLAIASSPETEARALEHLVAATSTAMAQLELSNAPPPSWLHPVGALLMTLAKRARKRVSGVAKAANDDANA